MREIFSVAADGASAVGGGTNSVRCEQASHPAEVILWRLRGVGPAIRGCSSWHERRKVKVQWS